MEHTKGNSNMRYKDSLELLAMVGQCYTKDFLLATKNVGSHQTRNLKKLIDDGWVVKSDIIVPDKSGSKTTSVVAITMKGRIHRCDMDTTNYYCDVAPTILEDFSTGVPEDLHRSLAQSRALLFMHQSGVRALMNEKPALSVLVALAKGNAPPTPADTSDTVGFYNNTLSLEETLEHGVYYTMKEYRNFLKATHTDKDGQDVTYGRAKGIYLNHEKTCMVYLTNTFNSKIPRMNNAIENRSVNNIQQHLLPLNHITTINALIIANNNSQIVNMGICGKFGHTEQHSKSSVDLIAEKYQWLNSSNKMYSKMYCFPHTTEGAESLRYFSSHTAKYRIEDFKRRTDNFHNFQLIPDEEQANKQLIARDLNTGNRATFVPFFELRYLNEVGNFYEELSIITHESMADSIAHIIRKSNPIYDMDSGQKIKTTVYQESGYPENVAPPEPKPKVRKTKSKKLKAVTVQFSEEEAKMIRLICGQRGMSMSRFLRKLIVPLVKEEYDKYGNYFELEEERRKLLEQAHFIPEGVKKPKLPE